MLNRYLKPENILPHFLWPSNRPSRVRCPVCGKAPLSLHLFIDPEDGGTAYYCTRCSFSGNTLELFQYLNGYATPADAIQYFKLNATQYQLPAVAFTNESVDRTLQAIALRKRINAYWAECQKNYINGAEPVWRAIANSLHIWQVGSIEYRKMLSAYVGASSRDHLEAHGFKSLGKGFKYFLILPYYSAPGRISAFLCVPESGFDNAQWKPMFAETDEPDYGLFGLVGEGLNEATCYIVNSPIMALQMLREKFTHSSSPVPVFAFADGTNIAYKNTAPSKVLWSHNRDLGFWKNVYTSKANVADDPQFRQKGNITPDDWYNFSRSRGIKQKGGAGFKLQQMSDSASLWSSALKNHLLSTDLSESIHLFAQLNLSLVDINILKAECKTDDEKLRLSSIIGQEGVSGIHIFNNRSYVLHGDGIYSLYKDGREEKITNVRLRPDRIVINPLKPTEKFVTGVIKGQDFEIPFGYDYEELSRHPSEALATILANEGQPHPYIAPQFEKMFFPFCCSLLSNIEQVAGTSKVGWIKNDFIAPCFTISDGNMTYKSNFIMGDYVPMQGVEPDAELTEGLVALWQSPDEGPTLLAVAAAFIHNILAPMYSVTKCGIGLTGKSSERILNALTKEFGLTRFVFDEVRGRYSARQLNKLQALEAQHDLPIIVDYTAKLSKSFRQWLANETKNSFISLTPLQSRYVTVANKWIIVENMPINSLAIRGFNQVIPLFIRHYQRTNGVLPIAKTLVRGILDELWKFLKNYKQPADDSVLAKAHELIRDESLIENRNLGDRVLNAIFSMIENGLVAPPRMESVTTPRNPLAYDTISGKFRIRKHSFIEAAKEAQLPLEYVDVDEITQAFMDKGILLSDNNNEGYETDWVLAYSSWESSYIRWLSGDVKAEQVKARSSGGIVAVTE